MSLDRQCGRSRRAPGLALAGTLAILALGAQAGDRAPSPWMLTPLVNSNPKLGTSAGAMGAYIKKFDPQAPPSMFGAMGQYSTTDSYTLGFFARAFLGADEHRIMAVDIHARANNDYQDFLGSGIELRSTDEVEALYLSYLNRVAGDWFLGAHAVKNDYAMLGTNDIADSILEELDLEGFNSNALGLKALYDSRDNTQSPSSGRLFMANQFAYREAFGGEEGFDVYSAQYRQYFPQADGSVFAARVAGRVSHDAPRSGYSTLRLRGYVPGEFREPHSLSVEGEERYVLSERWRLAAFAGLGCLFEHIDDCGDTGKLYASGGVGVHYVLRPREKMIVRLDYARGEGGTEGLYVKFGQSF
jgi:hypothetical protein